MRVKVSNNQDTLESVKETLEQIIPFDESVKLMWYGRVQSHARKFYLFKLVDS